MTVEGIKPLLSSGLQIYYPFEKISRSPSPDLSHIEFVWDPKNKFLLSLDTPYPRNDILKPRTRLKLRLPTWQTTALLVSRLGPSELKFLSCNIRESRAPLTASPKKTLPFSSTASL